jgi:LPXTG-motif cell wall-anchored protein
MGDPSVVNTLSRLPRWAAAFLSSVLAVLAGSIMLAAPAAALDPSTPVWGVRSLGEAVATRDTLSINDLVLEIGLVGTQEIKFTFQLEGCCENGTPARFLGGQTDTACRTVGAVPTTTVECVHTRQFPEPRDERFAFSFPISRPAPSGFPSIKMTITIGSGSSTRYYNAKRVRPEAEFVVTAGAPAQGRVGETVFFEWTLTNVGLDPVWARNGIITLTAPPGTEFTGAEFTDEMPDVICFTQGATPTRRTCYFETTEPGAANAHKMKWPLKIVSEQVGEGRVLAEMFNYYSTHIESDFVDPTPANNAVPIRVQVLPGSASPSPSASASVPPPPSAGDQLPTTGSRSGLMLGGGVIVLLAGVLLVLMARRRRQV